MSHSSSRPRRHARLGNPSSAPAVPSASAAAARTAGRLSALAVLALLPGALLVVPAQPAAAQQPAAGVGRVAGTVLGTTGTPVSNVQVTIVGTRFGSITDENGKYNIGGVPSGPVTVRAQRIGFQARTQQVTVTTGGVTAADFQLTAAATVLSEVRVQVGYTNEARRDVSGAVSSVTSNEIQDQKVATVEEAIRGRIPGVQISASGEPGRGAQIVIRGQQTLGDPSPLYVVDGMYVGNVNPNINPDDIQTIDVLKDASAAAQYGSQASKGVVVITTKRGRAGTNQFALNSYYGFQDVPKTLDIAGTPEWQRLWTQAYDNAGVPAANRASGVTTPQTINTNWQDAVFQKGAIQNYNLQASGGTATASYLISGSMLNQDGLIINSRFRRASVRANSQATLGRVTLSENISASQDNTRGLGSTTNNTAFYTLIDDVRMLPTIPVYDATTPSGFGFGSAANPTFGVNPVANLLVNTNDYRSNAVLGSASAQVALFKGISYRLNGGIDYNDGFNRYFRSIDQIRYRTTNTFATLNQERPNRTNTLVENLLTYDGNLGDGAHRISAVAGYSTQRVGFQNLSAYRQGFTNESLQQINAASNAGLNNSGYYTPFNTNSFLTRATYAFRDRYLASASVRQDCSSRFSANNKCGTFGAGSLGWVVSEEGFFKAIPVLGGASQFKLRASTGVLGDQNIGDFAYVAPLAQNINYPFGGNVANGSTQTVLVNTDLRWQSNRSSDVGFDLGLLGNTLTITADYFKNQVSNLLVEIPIPGSLGSTANPTVNAGKLNNAGFELGINHQLTRGALQFNTTFNASYLRNRMTSLGNGGQPIFRGSYGEARTAVGDPVGSWYVRKTCGIFQSDADAQAHTTTVNGKAVVLQPQARAGDLCFTDLNGDGIISDANDRYVAGNGTPKWTGGLFLNTKYRSVDLGVNLVGKYGFKIFNAVRIQTDRMDDLGGVRAGYTPWTPENHSTTTPIALFNNNGPSAARATSNVYGLSDRWLENGKFTRIQNIVLGYTLPQNVLQRLRIGSTRAPRIYVNAQNLYTFTGYTNWDPDVLGLGNALSRGEDDGTTYPTPRTVTFGLDVRF